MMKNERYEIVIDDSGQSFWKYRLITGECVTVSEPIFELDGHDTKIQLKSIFPCAEPRLLRNSVMEYQFKGVVNGYDDLFLRIIFRIAPDNSFLRFRYILESDKEYHLTKKSGCDNLDYFSVNLNSFQKKKIIHFSEFIEAEHSYNLVEHTLHNSFFENELSAMGPILTAESDKCSVLLAYEHGSQVPDEYLRYQFNRNYDVTLEAVKGNYYNGYMISQERSFETVWFEIGLIVGGEEKLASHYRQFMLKYMTENLASREPYIFYNTWNYQERNKWWNNNYYLTHMDKKRMLAEIDVASRMGIDVFVIDTGWYEKTGDWLVSKKRFPNMLKNIKRTLDEKGMKLGLWFSPQASLSSRILENNMDCRCAYNDQEPVHEPVWKTEDSFQMCYVSKYWESFADKLIELNKELGVNYFKWDAIAQRGCNDYRHFHGGKDVSLKERDDCQAFEQVRYMGRIIDKICAACPDAIVDFDITEAHRSVGLAFLASGKYFLINNGPYYQSLGDPVDKPGGGMGTNVFVFPGPARARICRKPLNYDKWIPSILFLTHYLPDDLVDSQIINVASLILGQNGIWGDLMNVSEGGVAYINKLLSLYKQVKYDITESDPVRFGIIGGSPEIHEKISSNGKGAVVVFAENNGCYSYVTTNRVEPVFWKTDGVQVSFDDKQRAILKITFEQPGAHIIFFGVNKS